jgi:photosynthetic reaction center cytochrome c subunit
MERRAASAWPAEEKPKQAEEVYKNIQIFKGMPAAQLMTAMGTFTKSLGVDCAYCHVPGAFEKDDKAAKQTARAMLRMVGKINGDNFNGASPVTCWTCHRGASKPESQAPQ